MKHPKKYFFLIALLSGIAFSALFINARRNDRDRYQQDFADKYRVYAVTVPTHLNFCGEKMPANDFEVFERFDRELTVNTYYQSSTILNIKRGSRYFPIIEPILKRNGVPDDFKYVCMIESGLSNVTSPSNAVGFWQFIEETGKRFGLQIDEEVDERYDIVKSTEAACAYFNKAHDQFQSWTLAAASYNMGINGIQGSLNKQEADNYYDLYLNNETSRYIMRVLAIKEIYEHPKIYGYYIPQFLRYPPVPVYTEKITGPIENFTAFAKAHQISYKTFKTLNPWLRKNELKNPEARTYYVSFPQEGAEHLVSDVYGYDEQPDSIAAPVIVPVDSITTVASLQDSMVYVEISHQVERKEDINDIARRYHTTVPKIMIWNNLSLTVIKKDQLLKILVRKDLLEGIKIQDSKK